jgi:gas vesicle protein
LICSMELCEKTVQFECECYEGLRLCSKHYFAHYRGSQCEAKDVKTEVTRKLQRVYSAKISLDQQAREIRDRGLKIIKEVAKIVKENILSIEKRKEMLDEAVKGQSRSIENVVDRIMDEFEVKCFKSQVIQRIDEERQRFDAIEFEVIVVKASENDINVRYK